MRLCRHADNFFVDLLSFRLAAVQKASCHHPWPALELQGNRLQQFN
jgi:hypothetical protein